MKANVPKKVEDSYEDTQEFKFLRGYTDDNGVLHTTFAIREMDGSDEEQYPILSSKAILQR